MATLQDTNLLLQVAPLPATFRGDPNEFLKAIIQRAKIVSPTGIQFIFVGDVEPTSNVGPWLKNGTQWWVFDPDIKRYVPLDISASETKWFQVGSTTPATSSPPVWLRTTKDQTEADPSIGDPIGWYVFDGAAWVSFTGITFSGPTASRPGSPVELQQFYDTDITCLIWWERGMWRTVAGVPGDCKFVAFPTLTEALQSNPGWEVFGASNQSLRGRIPMMAAKDSGPNPVTVLTVNSGIAQRAAFETFGETDAVVISNPGPVPYPPQVALWFLVKD